MFKSDQGQSLFVYSNEMEGKVSLVVIERQGELIGMRQ